MIQNQNNELSRSQNENPPLETVLETNLDDSLEVQEASNNSVLAQNGHYISFANGLDPPKNNYNHKVRKVFDFKIFFY